MASPTQWIVAARESLPEGITSASLPPPWSAFSGSAAEAEDVSDRGSERVQGRLIAQVHAKAVFSFHAASAPAALRKKLDTQFI